MCADFYERGDKPQNRSATQMADVVNAQLKELVESWPSKGFELQQARFKHWRRNLALTIENLIEEKRSVAEPEVTASFVDSTLPEINDFDDKKHVDKAHYARSYIRAFSEQIQLAGILASTSLATFPRRHFFRLVIDAFQLAKRFGPITDAGEPITLQGAFTFDDQEPGYLAAMLGALRTMLATVNTPLDAASYLQLHDACCMNVQTAATQPDAVTLTPLAAGYRNDTGVEYSMKYAVPVKGAPSKAWDEARADGDGAMAPLSATKAGNEGLAQAIKSKEAYDLGGWSALGKAQEGVDRVTRPTEGLAKIVKQSLIMSPRSNPNECAEKAAAIIKRYTDRVKPDLEPDTRIDLIAECCQRLDQAHLFRDGNIRTIAFLVLNKLLIQNKLSPVILWEPNGFDGWDAQQLRRNIRIGQLRFGSYPTSPWCQHVDNDPQNHLRVAQASTSTAQPPPRDSTTAATDPGKDSKALNVPV